MDNYPEGEAKRPVRGATAPDRRNHDFSMDTEGARALAERIASGPPQEEGEESRAPQAAPQAPAPPKQEDASAVEILYLKPDPAPRREVRIYVRRPEGELERRS